MLIEEYFVPFFFDFIGSLKGNMTISASEEGMKLLESFKIPVSKAGHYELEKMDRTQYLSFRYVFVEQRRTWPAWIEEVSSLIDHTGKSFFDSVLSAICMVMCR
jgi:hypothetical protein